MSEYLLEMTDISKAFPGVQALDKACLRLRPGTVHALMGENGAGKSTLMKCLFGVYTRDSGNILYNGEPLVVHNTHDALTKGIAMVQQELQPIPDRSIAENIYCGKYPVKRFLGLKFVDHKKMYEDTQELLDRLNMPFDAKQKLGTLSASQMQLVEIAKAVSNNAKVVIMDEPTSSLSLKEVDTLFDIIRTLRDQGCGIIYISHKMQEILEISDEVTIMRDGQYIGTWPASELSTDDIITRMVGRELTNLYPPKISDPGEVAFEVTDFTSIDPRSFRDVSFSVRKGEILGVGGLVGAQRTELMEAIFGLRSHTTGEIKLHGRTIKIASPTDAISNGIALLTEDRRGSGIFGVLSVEDNISVASLRDYLKFRTFLDEKKLASLTEDNIGKLSIKTPSTKTQIQNLSGGNQQKVIVSRWLAKDPDILIMDEPTRGIDVGAKYEIYCIIRDLAREGKSIIMVSSEMGELIGVADRIMVMCDGRVSGFVTGDDMNQEKIMELAVSFM
ncbi:MAG: sugar ABC transporter ATP-binding protein [Eubacteriaceae bacterium]|nr:sugar ABC transporter ATP-binding protein [Eubacteriaceae bacterium]